MGRGSVGSPLAGRKNQSRAETWTPTLQVPAWAAEGCDHFFLPERWHQPHLLLYRGILSFLGLAASPGITQF